MTEKFKLHQIFVSDPVVADEQEVAIVLQRISATGKDETVKVFVFVPRSDSLSELERSALSQARELLQHCIETGF